MVKDPGEVPSSLGQPFLVAHDLGSLGEDWPAGLPDAPPCPPSGSADVFLMIILGLWAAFKFFQFVHPPLGRDVKNDGEKLYAFVKGN